MNKFLLRQNGKYYTIKSEFYDGNNFTPIVLENSTKLNNNDFKNYGFDNLSLLTQNITISKETFRPVDKLIGEFDIVMKKIE